MELNSGRGFYSVTWVTDDDGVKMRLPDDVRVDDIKRGMEFPPIVRISIPGRRDAESPTAVDAFNLLRRADDATIYINPSTMNPSWMQV